MTENFPNGKVKKIIKSPKGQQRLEQLLQTGAELFARKGYFNTSIEDLADKTGIGKATVYHYFKSKDEFFFAILEQGFEEFFNRLDRALSSEENSLGKLTVIARTYFQFYLDQPQVFQVLTRESRAFGQKFKSPLPDMFRNLEERTEFLIRKGIATGEFRDLNPQISAQAFLGMIDFLVTNKSFANHLEVEKVLDIIVNIIGNGLLMPGS